MQKLILAGTATTLLLGLNTTAFAKVSNLPGVDTFQIQNEIDKRSKPRIPGGSGCDDPEDLIEHPECRG
ncbi:MAG: hypothetical protein B7Z02_12525 [Rhodobacterales bacterium 32-67-9]|nr:MAG: hypothetical protein B7Z02_12525 [Rhodobacterales bacterium 32-67-9]